MSELDFEPNWFSKPGSTLAKMMDQKSLSIRELASRLGTDSEEVKGLVSGSVVIDEDLAARLADVLGASSSFWIKRQAEYNSCLKRVAQKVSSESASEWLKNFPRTEMQKLGWIPEGDRGTLVERYLAYFGVNGPADWEKKYRTIVDQFEFRTSKSFRSKIGPLSAWLRQGELEAEKRKVAKWNPNILSASLARFRKLTWQKNPSSFVPELTEAFAAAGVAIIFIKAPSGCSASGAARFISSNKAMMLLSFRHRSDDQFWFTLFHEIGHLLLHGPLNDLSEISWSQREAEANAFATNQLVPMTHRERMVDLPPKKEPILRFARQIGIAPGIVVGQMQHAGIISHTQLNFLKRRYDWEQIQAACHV